MSTATLEKVLELAKQLSQEEQLVLLRRLQAKVPRGDTRITLQQLIAEHDALVASGAFDHVESLAGRFGPPRPDISEEALRATIHEAATEWEKELDEFYDKS